MSTPTEHSVIQRSVLSEKLSPTKVFFLQAQKHFSNNLTGEEIDSKDLYRLCLRKAANYLSYALSCEAAAVCFDWFSF